IDGVTRVTKLDGTHVTTSGTDMIGSSETIAINGNGFKKPTHPALGADTTIKYTAAGAPTTKIYADGVGEAYTYHPGGLLHKTTLARGGELVFGYSGDGAKDLTSASWPALSSGSFAIPAYTEGYGYDRAGRLDEIGASSGVHTLAYQNGRATETAWNSGPLAGYKIIRGFDEYGRLTGFELWSGNSLIHSATKAPNGVSGEVSGISSGGFVATYGRDGSRNITSITRGSVTQNWPRSGGRITAANSIVSGAPSFAYNSFDTKGRRLNATTAGGDWTYGYTNGQLTSATHPTLGNFTYQFDGIGRRTDKGANNTTDLLNRTLGWTNSQSKTLKIIAHPDARVWVNGAEIPDFTGTYDYPIPSPGPEGGLVPWSSLAILPDQGDAGAGPDAKAEKSGTVLIPPASVNYDYDDAGNRESSSTWDYGWDARNNLVRARSKGYNSPSTVEGFDITCDYDSEGRRFSKKVDRYQNGTLVEQKTVTFLWDGWDLI
ncbi:MAG: hypothetical protein CFE26_24505, partial [Verrucomicrobiales bacterium VVV1]